MLERIADQVLVAASVEAGLADIAVGGIWPLMGSEGACRRPADTLQLSVAVSRWTGQDGQRCVGRRLPGEARRNEAVLSSSVKSVWVSVARRALPGDRGTLPLVDRAAEVERPLAAVEPASLGVPLTLRCPRSGAC